MRSFNAYSILCGLAQVAPLLASPLNSVQKRSLSYGTIDGSATCGAKALLAKLQSTYGTSYMSGQQDRANLQWVQQNIGKTPAIQGNDFIDYSPSRVAYGAVSHAVEDAQAFDGINAFVWHWNAPTDLYNTASEPWYSGFYTAATSFNVATALAEGPSGSDYQLLLRDIDAIAVEIQRLSDSGISFLWRPLHEPDGGWFWWGAQGPEAFLQLWDLLYDRLTNYHDLHNMVWVCNTMVSDWYPGNEKCDIVTTDIYASTGDHSSQGSSYSTLESLCGGERVIALAEVGEIPDPEQQKSDGVPWAYWMTWSGDYISGNSYNTIDFLDTVYNDALIVTLDGANQLGAFGCGLSPGPSDNSSSSVAPPGSTAPGSAAPSGSVAPASSTAAVTTYPASSAAPPSSAAAVSSSSLAIYANVESSAAPAYESEAAAVSSLAVVSSAAAVSSSTLAKYPVPGNGTQPAGPTGTCAGTGCCGGSVVTVTIYASSAVPVASSSVAGAESGSAIPSSSAAPSSAFAPPAYTPSRHYHHHQYYERH